MTVLFLIAFWGWCAAFGFSMGCIAGNDTKTASYGLTVMWTFWVLLILSLFIPMPPVW